MKFVIVVGSIRENRVTDRQAKWLQRVAQDVAGDHEWELLDLKDYDLPMFDEPFPPMDRKRPELSEQTREYLSKMDAADGFIIVTAEYNHGMPSALKNAIDLLDYQLMKKPIAIASHGVVGGARANEHVRLVVNSSLGGVPIPNSVTFYGIVDKLIDENGELSPDADQANSRSARNQVESLVWYADALKTKREV